MACQAKRNTLGRARNEMKLQSIHGLKAMRCSKSKKNQCYELTEFLLVCDPSRFSKRPCLLFGYNRVVSQVQDQQAVK